MTIRRDSPYIWTTWLSRLLAGDSSCEWAAWFKAHFQDYPKTPDTFDEAAWRLAHTELLNKTRSRLEVEGKTVMTQSQNLFRLKGNTGITLGGKPDIIAATGKSATIYDMRTGEPRATDKVQVLAYMYAVPLAFPEYRGMDFDGAVVYGDHEVAVPSDAVDDGFKSNLVSLIRRIGADTPTIRVPSAAECGICDITPDDCPERVDEPVPEVTPDEDPGF